jgi:hypothetical protein
MEECPLCAKSGLMHRSKRHPVIRLSRRRLQAGTAECSDPGFRGLNIDGEVELARLDDGQIDGLCAF